VNGNGEAVHSMEWKENKLKESKQSNYVFYTNANSHVFS